jgi:hypothetical protein
MPEKRCAHCRTVYLMDFHIGRFICQPCKDRQEHARITAQEQRWCRTCRSHKPVKDFAFLEELDARDTICKLCRRKQAERQHGRKLYRDHKITRDIYEQLLAKQESRCAICRIALADLQALPGRHNHALHVDHNHQTGQIRGLLCQQCNHGLGRFHDNPALLLSAIQYLARAEERSAMPQPTPQPALKPKPKPKRVPDYSKVARSLRLLKQRQQESA